MVLRLFNLFLYCQYYGISSVCKRKGDVTGWLATPPHWDWSLLYNGGRALGPGVQRHGTLGEQSDM